MNTEHNRIELIMHNFYFKCCCLLYTCSMVLLLNKKKQHQTTQIYYKSRRQCGRTHRKEKEYELRNDIRKWKIKRRFSSYSRFSCTYLTYIMSSLSSSYNSFVLRFNISVLVLFYFHLNYSIQWIICEIYWIFFCLNGYKNSTDTQTRVEKLNVYRLW